MKRFKIIFTLFIFFACTNSLYSQNWDYEKYPKLDIDLLHLNADLRIDEFGMIEGDVLYRASVKIDDPDSLIFDASRLNIQTVSVNDAEKDFSVQNDHLIIYLDQVFARESVLNIRIQYQANPHFGVLRDVNRTTWTSQLPKTTRHWLPVIDHPRVQFTTEFVFTYPSGNTMIANGRRENSGVLSVDEERSTFVATNPIPVTALGWVLGDLTQVSSTTVSRLRRDGNQSPIQVRVYSESSLTGGSDLADLTSSAVQSVRDELGVSYPYRDLNVVVLDNDFWETKWYAAGIIFAYRDHGNIEQQIQRGVISQWFGTSVREEQWSDADAIHAVHALLADQLFDFEPIMDINIEPYDVFSFYNFSRWGHFLSSNELPRFKANLQTGLNNILNNNSNILSWNSLAEFLYEESGQPFFEGFELGELETQQVDSIEYVAQISWNEMDNTVQINFEAMDGSVDELVSVAVEEITFQGANEHEVTFTGSSESSVLNVSSGIENLQLQIQDRDDIKLLVEKPFMFWIYQLRNDTVPEERAEAAKALAGFTDNPDLQLALNDILRVESNPQVYAEIVRSLATLTAGAAGMDERFLDYSSSQQNTVVRKAAIEALAGFPNNERVISRLQNIILQSNNTELQEEAVRSLAEVTEPSRFNTIAGNLVSREPVLLQVPLILELLAEKDEAESAVEMASTFITDQFPYDVRKQALEVILEYDRASENWEERLPELFSDIHPEIRYRAASALEYVNPGSRNDLAEQFLMEEYDERVRRVLKNATN